MRLVSGREQICVFREVIITYQGDVNLMVTIIVVSKKAIVWFCDVLRVWVSSPFDGIIGVKGGGPIFVYGMFMCYVEDAFDLETM